MSGTYLFLIVLLLFGRVSTPVATPVSIGNSPEWTVPLSSGAAVEPLLIDDLVIIALGDRTVVAMNSITGDLIWSAVINEQVNDRMVAAGDVVLIPGAGGTLVAISADTGKVVNAISLGPDALTRPNLLNGTLVVSNVGGTVFILDPDSFETRNALVLPSGLSRGEVVGDLVVFAASGGMIIAVNIDDATIAWQAVMPASASMIRATNEANVFVGLSPGDLILLDGSDGTLLWQQIYTDAALSDVALTDNEILAISTSGDLLVLDPSHGTRLWQDVLPERGWFAADRCKETCFIATDDGMLTTYSAAGMQVSSARTVTGALSVPPASSGTFVIVVTSLGDVSAWELTPE